MNCFRKTRKNYSDKMTAQEIIQTIQCNRFDLQDEKVLQNQISQSFDLNFVVYRKEFRLDEKNILDFLIDDVGVEVKIKGSKRQIYKQCERYCGFDRIKSLLLITNRSMGFPSEINGKPIYIFNLGKSWL